MKDNRKIVEEVNKTLSLMEQQETLEPNPYLFTRVTAKINAPAVEAGFWAGGLKYIQISLFILLFSFNLYSVIAFLHDSESQTELRNEYVDSLWTEYSLNSGYYINTAISEEK